MVCFFFLPVMCLDTRATRCVDMEAVLKVGDDEDASLSREVENVV